MCARTAVVCAVVCAVRTAAQGLLTPGGWEETSGMLLCAWDEQEGWQKEEESPGSGWQLQKRMVAEGCLQRGSEGDEG